MPSKIEWTEETWNPTTGCTKVSPGCAHCYAEALSLRYGWSKLPWTPANERENVILHPDRLNKPLTWKTPRRVFVNSMSDLFHEAIPDEYIDRVFAIMALTPQHTYQVLTKRADRMRRYMMEKRTAHFHDGSAVPKDYTSADFVRWAETEIIENASWADRKRMDNWPNAGEWDWPLPNVWLGVTVENQHWANIRVPILMLTSAAVHFVSAEPLLSAVDLTMLNVGKKPGQLGDFNQYIDALNGRHCDGMGFERVLAGKHRLNWVIVGGESGPKHRPFKPAWARSIVRQCKEANVACFVKQLGGFRPGNKLEELPPDLRVREFP